MSEESLTSRRVWQGPWADVPEDLTEIPNIPVRAENSDGSWGIEMITRSEWERRRPKEPDA